MRKEKDRAGWNHWVKSKAKGELKRGLFLLRASAIQASLIALGLASVLFSPFSFKQRPPP